MDNIYTYVVPLPAGVNEAVLSCADGYTVYIDDSLTEAERVEAYNHAVRHIYDQDFEKMDVQEIETNTHAS